MTMTTHDSHLSTARGAQKEVDAPGSTPEVSGLSLDRLNEATEHETALTLLAGLYEHSDWIIEKALAARPFQTLAHFRQVCRDVVTTAPLDAQLALIRAHPELTGKAKIDPDLARDSKSEQQAVGLDRCSPDEFEALTQLNARYKERFGWPFILAVRGPRGRGLTRGQIITTLERRLKDPPDQERKECIHQIHRIAEMRLNERFGIAPIRGERIWDDCQTLSSFSEDAPGSYGELPHEVSSRSCPLADSVIQRRGISAGPSGRGWQCGWSLGISALPAHRKPFRHGEKWWPLRWPSWHPGSA